MDTTRFLSFCAPCASFQNINWFSHVCDILNINFIENINLLRKRINKNGSSMQTFDMTHLYISNESETINSDHVLVNPMM